jgi:hypothetical protein
LASRHRRPHFLYGRERLHDTERRRQREPQAGPAIRGQALQSLGCERLGVASVEGLEQGPLEARQISHVRMLGAERMAFEKPREEAAE